MLTCRLVNWIPFMGPWQHTWKHILFIDIVILLVQFREIRRVQSLAHHLPYPISAPTPSAPLALFSSFRFGSLSAIHSLPPNFWTPPPKPGLQTTRPSIFCVWRGTGLNPPAPHSEMLILLLCVCVLVREMDGLNYFSQTARSSVSLNQCPETIYI